MAAIAAAGSASGAVSASAAVAGCQREGGSTPRSFRLVMVHRMSGIERPHKWRSILLSPCVPNR